MNADDLDASFLMWDIRRNLHLDKLLQQRVVIYFEFAEAKKGMKQWWLVVGEGEVDLCLDDPGLEVDVTLSTTLRTMTQVWMGDIALGQARAQGLLRATGSARLVRSLGNWLGASPFAHVAPAASNVAATV